MFLKKYKKKPELAFWLFILKELLHFIKEGFIPFSRIGFEDFLNSPKSSSVCLSSSRDELGPNIDQLINWSPLV